MKYIVTVDENFTEEIFIFPKAVNHDCMAEVIEGIRSRTTGSWKRIRRTPISAGFVDIGTGNCYGESISLGLKSRPEKDSEILKTSY